MRDKGTPGEDVLDWNSDASTIVECSPAYREQSLRPTNSNFEIPLDKATYHGIPKAEDCSSFDPIHNHMYDSGKSDAQSIGTMVNSGFHNHIAEPNFDALASALTPVAETILEEADEPETTEIESPWPSLYSEDTPIMDEDHHLTPFKKEYLEVVMFKFDEFQKISPGDTDENRDGQPSSPMGFNNRGQGESSSNNSGKRPLSSSGSNTGSGGTSSSGRSSKRRAVERRFTFACPLAKKDPIRHRECYHKILTRIRDVKQHINRCHYLPVYCPRCMETFDDESARDTHIRSISCQERPFVQFEGCSKSQRDQLSHRVSQKLPQEKQWYTVFDILFPGHPHPLSPLVDREIFEPMAAFRDFMTDQGPSLMLDFFNSRGVALDCQPQEERDLLSLQQTIIREGLEIILSKAMPALSKQSSNNDATETVALQRPEPTFPAAQAAPTLTNEEADEVRRNQDSILETRVDNQVQAAGGIWSNSTRGVQGDVTSSFFDSVITEEPQLDENGGGLGFSESNPGLGSSISNFRPLEPNEMFDFATSAEWSLSGVFPDFQTGT
ncbi:hypothetical protein VM1G_08795 [Cytospora mali]|uniref:C2H2-type domain-containing protein n=1 Tax=Cytospora mali TaxID=578113 RepID=A0A194WAY9_CYTMA|nr:hypothetical protein VM1G_08795 [Valsa mali]